jgi:hypothetical protein
LRSTAEELRRNEFEGRLIWMCEETSITKSLVNQRPEPTLWRSLLWPSTFVVTILDRSKKSMSKPVTIATIMNLSTCESLLQWASIMAAS